MSNRPPGFHGNDTIDCYPPETLEIKKILVVSEKIFKAIQNNFNLFSRGLTGRPVAQSLNLGADRGQIFEPKSPAQTFISKFSPTQSPEYFRDYQPSNAIYTNYSDQRRWMRVKEWFSQYAQGAEEKIFEKEILAK